MPVVVSSLASAPNVCSVLWNNALANGVVTASHEAVGYPAVNAIKDPATWNSWRGTSAGNNIQSVIPVAANFNCVGIAAHNLATSGASLIRVFGTPNGTVWNGIMSYAPVTDEDIVMLFPQQSLRGIRVFVDGAPANIGVLFGGQTLEFAHSPIVPYVPLYHGKNYTKTFNSSIGGQLLSNRVVAQAAETSVDLWCLGRNWTDTAMRGFEEHYNQGGTFFYMSNPESYPRDMGYCTAAGEDSTIAVTYEEGPDLATVSFDIKAYMSV